MTLFAVVRWLVYGTLRGSVVIALVAAVLALAGKRIGARWRHALWLIVLIRLAVPFAPVSSLSVFNYLPMSDPVQVASLRMAAGAPAAQSQTVAMHLPSTPSPVLWLIAIWMTGAALLLARVVIATLRVHRAVRIATRARGERRDLTALIDASRARLRIARRVRAIECDGVRAPALHGLFRPTLLLPVGFGSTFDARETRHVVLHELWHLRRHDIPLNWILAIVQALHWFNPFVWYAISRIGEERELVCDELALSCLEEDERTSYGHTIVKLLDRFRAEAPVPALVGIVNRKEMMKRRLMMIASFRNRTRFSLLFLAAVALIVTVGFTDPAHIEKHIRYKLDAETMEALKPLHQPLSFDLNDASLSDLLGTIANKTGVVVKQAPEIATSAAQQARFTIHAENIPASVMLNEAISPFGLWTSAQDGALTIRTVPKTDEEPEELEAEQAAPGTMHTEERRIVINKDSDEASAPHAEHMILRHGAPEAMPANGKSHRELTIKLSQNGVETNGKMTIDIAAPPATK